MTFEEVLNNRPTAYDYSRKKWNLLSDVDAFVASLKEAHEQELNALRESYLAKIVEDMDGVFLDGWGEGGFLYHNGAEDVSVSFENDLVMVVTDVPNVSSMHIKWTSISEIDNIGWLLHYKAYEWLYRGLRYYDQSSEQLKYLTDHKNLYFFA